MLKADDREGSLSAELRQDQPKTDLIPEVRCTSCLLVTAKLKNNNAIIPCNWRSLLADEFTTIHLITVFHDGQGDDRDCVLENDIQEGM